MRDLTHVKLEPMIEHLRRELAPKLPLIIKEAAFADPTLTLAGEGWAVSSPYHPMTRRPVTSQPRPTP
jgi:hypothetical protein